MTTLENMAATAGAGDLDAADALVRGVHDHLFAFLHVRGIPAGDIDDVAQRVALQMLSGLKRYSPDRSFLPWFRGVARNVTSDYWRTRKKEAGRTSVFHEYFIPHLEAAEEDLEQHKMHTQGLTDCMEQLQGRQRQLVRMRYFDKLTSLTMGEALNMKPATVRQMLSRIRILLRSCIENTMAPEGMQA